MTTHVVIDRDIVLAAINAYRTTVGEAREEAISKILDPVVLKRNKVISIIRKVFPKVPLCTRKQLLKG